jgi:hypothetical protein
MCSMTRLPDVLSVADLPIAELCAARMDGQVIVVDECFSPVDQPVGPSERAAALRAIAGSRAVAHGRSALWVHGLSDDPPAVHTVWVARQDRGTVRRTRRLLVRETRFLDGDLARIGRNLVVSPVRMVFDLVRDEVFGPAEAAALTLVVAAFGLDPDVCLARIEAVPNLPGRRRALARWSGAGER